MSARKGNKTDVENNLSDAICFIVLEKGYDLGRLMKLDCASFIVLLQFLEKQAEDQKKEMDKVKKKGKR